MDFKVEWEAISYLIGGKMFAMHSEDKDKDKNPIITLKCEPSFGQVLRAENKYIVAGLLYEQRTLELSMFRW